MSAVLGLDIGTSKVAIAVIGGSDKKLQAIATQEIVADLPPRGEGFFEQDTLKIQAAIKEAFAQIDHRILKKVEAIGITGQMHGVVPWNSENGRAGPLITWQDLRCNKDNFLDKFQKRTGDSNIKSGYGLASLAWLFEYSKGNLKDFDRASTIHDFIACQACGLKEAFTDPGNAQSWGLFDLKTLSWNSDQIERSKIPRNLIPTICPTGSDLGHLVSEYAALWGLPAGTPIIVPIGDNQASLYSTFSNNSKEIALTIGTAAQLSVVLSDGADISQQHPGMEIRPYVDGTFIAVAAALCGGQAFAWLVNAIREWANDLDLGSPESNEIFQRLDQLALGCLDTPLRVTSSFLGERHDPKLRGSILNIGLDNFSLGNLFSGIAQGTILNLYSMLPQEILQGRNTVVGSGNGLRRLRITQEWIKKIFGLPLLLKNTTEEAAQGAALIALDSYSK